MTERSRFWTTNNTGDGPAIGYSTSDWEKIVRHWFQSGDEANAGILFGILNALTVSGTASPVAVNTGAAIVYGHYYENDASLNLAVTTPVVGTTGFRVGLRVSWAAQTVRAFLTRNTDGLSAIPALTQSAGTTWEISLATGTITTGGVVALTDTRKFLRFSTKIYGDQFDAGVVDNATLENTGALLRVKDDGISNAKLRNSAALSVIGRSANSTGDPADIAAANDNEVLRRSGTALGFALIATANVADNAIDDTKAGNRVPQFYRRQGGSASDWQSAGTTTQTPGAVRMQGGALNTGASSGTVTFPVAFSQPPLVFAQVIDSVNTAPIVRISNVTASGFSWLTATAVGGGTLAALPFNWLAIGAE